VSLIYQRLVTHWRLSHFDAMFRFPLGIAFAQLAAILEEKGQALTGPTWAERAAAAALEREEQRLLNLYRTS
jgi:hypothetical protein